MKKLCMGLLVMSLLLVGCNGKDESLVEGKVNVVTTLYPVYFLAQEIGGENAHVVNLVPAGVEPHDWTPKSKDLKIASEAQIFLFNGAGLEGWVDDFLQGLNSDSKLLTLETSHGIELIRSSPDDSDDHGDEQAGEEEGTEGHDDLHSDPHTWVSPKSALRMAENIRYAFVEADPAHQANYESRFQSLQKKLAALDAEFTAGLSAHKGKDIVVSHQAFGYLTRDYGLHQTAVMGLSPEAEPGAQDMVKIINFIKEKQIKAIFFEELVSNGLAETIANETDVETLVLNPVEGLTPEQEQAGDDYFSLMRRNLQNLQKALQ